MKIVGSLLLLLINIWTTTTMAAETNSIGHSSHDRRLQVDRYTGYKTSAALEEVNPLLVLTQINFPSAIKTVQEAIDHALQRSGYRVDWQQSFEAYSIFSGLDIPVVHRKLNLMTLKDAIATLAGEAWQLLVDSVNRKLVIRMHAYVPWQGANGFNGIGMHRPHIEESISPLAQMQANHYLSDNSVPARTELNRYPSDNSVPAQTELNRYPLDNSVPAQTELNRYPSDNSVPAQTELNRYPSDNSVPARTELNRYPSDNFMPAQTEINGYLSDSSVSVPVEQKHFQHEYPALPVEQFVSDTNVAYDDVSENAVIHDEPTADAVYFGEAKTETPVADNADLYDETSDRPRNQYTQRNTQPYHVAKMSYMNNADSSDKIPSIHRVQYKPEYSESPYTGLSKLDKPKPLEGNDTNSHDLWSVQSVIKAKEGVGSLDEPVIVHYSSISVKDLIEILIPKGWVVHYEVSDAILKQKLVSHAESSRRNALSSLFKELNLKALFYPGQAVVVVAEKEPKSYDYGHSAKFRAIDSRDIDVPKNSALNPSDAYKSQPEVDTILRNAKTIKNLMNEMEPNSK